MNWVVRLDVIVLALMLGSVVVVVARISFRYLAARRVGEIDSARTRKLAAVLSIELGSLKAIASTAPYLGLAGTCVGVMSPLWIGGAMEKNTFLTMVAANMAAALATTAAGILVAVPATCSYNYLCGRKDVLESEVSNDPPAAIVRSPQRARRLVLTKQFSQLPAFAIIAAPGLAALVAVFTPYFAPREPTGLEVELASTCPDYDGNYRLMVLHITDAGKLFLNQDQQTWSSLASRLSEIYSVRVHRTLYLVADDGVPFQRVADALDTVENVPVAVRPQAAGIEKEKLDITVLLLTPRASNPRCQNPPNLP